MTAVHAAAVEPDRWLDAMSLVRTTLGSTGSGVISGDGSARDIKCCSVPDTEALVVYRDYYRQFDYVLDAMDTSAVGLVHSGDALVALNPRSEFNVDWMRRYAMDDGLFVRVTDRPHPNCLVIAAPQADEPFADTDNVRFVNALVPHLQHALHAQRTLADLQQRHLTVHPVDCLSAAALVVTPDLRVICANFAGESLLRDSTAVFVRRGRVHLTAPAADTEFRRALADATLGTDSGARTGDCLQVPRPGARRALIMHVSPLQSRERPAALVVIVDPDARREPPKHLVRRLFSLTNTEAEVAMRMSSGASLATVADEMSLSLATVKTHVQHVYDKTDTHRQAELVRLLLAIMP
ncbi:helix-turn-helix transcriptional regulator [Mycolicibacterium chubuense]|uniref:helix-turn-helix transcriptional regulator n=1 Tax=Mycolicibacterium chubuense TaxID=1800 RepID=UPI001EF02CA1|nr:helix-turn-helix transcriptional regulator [Mycolicibacterium chubuense]